MKCPHCLALFTPATTEGPILVNDLRGPSALNDADGSWRISVTTCPGCQRSTILLKREKRIIRAGQPEFQKAEILAWPKGYSRAALSPEVPEAFAGDYREACLVLADSPKASAALSRRCLQNLLRDHVQVKRGNLYDEISELLDSKTLPSDLAESVDAVRNIGNFAAHPEKSTNTGAIIDVEPGEAEWLLDVLESLFDFYFVRPAVLAKKRAALNAKLKDAGKPPTR